MKELCATGNSLQRQDLPQRQKPCPSEARPTIQTSPTGKSPALHTQALSYRDKTSCFTDTRPPALQGQDLLAYRGKTSPRGARTALQALELPYRGKTSTKPERPALQTKDLQRPALQTKELPYRGKTGPTGARPALQALDLPYRQNLQARINTLPLLCIPGEDPGQASGCVCH